MIKILSVVGARPNFMKLAPVARALSRRELGHIVVHTGQHYDVDMSGTFFRDLDIPTPDCNLGVGSGSHAQQTAAIMERIEGVLLEHRPDTVLVYGDVNSTVAAALVAAKLGIRTAHVEAGLRSRDWRMPEEINRVVTDRLADMLFTPSRDGNENLLAEGVSPERIHLVGNVMIDTLTHALPAARATGTAAGLGVAKRPYVVVTLHRPSNVDEPSQLQDLLDALVAIGRRAPVIFPVHPRTRQRIAALGFEAPRDVPLHLIEPIGYLEMLGLVDSCALVVTDSGGLQEETSYLGIPCVTVRENTERPVTVTQGTNRLVEPNKTAVVEAAASGLEVGRRTDVVIERWDGNAAERIADVLVQGASDS